MPPGRSPQISPRWVVASFFIVAGGVFFIFWCGLLGSLTHALPTSVVFAVGAVVGGLVAGIASRGRTVIEPALGAVLFVAALCGVYAHKGTAPLLWEQRTSAGAALYYFGFLTAIGALTGATLGERIARAEWFDKRFLWGAVSLLMTMGGLFVTSLVGSVWTGGFILYVFDGEPSSIALAIVIAVAAAMATQGMAPIKIPWTASSGLLTASGLFFVVLAKVGLVGSGAVPTIIVGLVGVPLAQLGAKFVWKKFPPAKPVAEEPIPTARVIG